MTLSPEEKRLLEANADIAKRVAGHIRRRMPHALVILGGVDEVEAAAWGGIMRSFPAFRKWEGTSHRGYFFMAGKHGVMNAVRDELRARRILLYSKLDYLPCQKTGSPAVEALAELSEEDQEFLSLLVWSGAGGLKKARQNRGQKSWRASRITADRLIKRIRDILDDLPQPPE